MKENVTCKGWKWTCNGSAWWPEKFSRWLENNRIFRAIGAEDENFSRWPEKWRSCMVEKMVGNAGFREKRGWVGGLFKKE